MFLSRRPLLSATGIITSASAFYVGSNTERREQTLYTFVGVARFSHAFYHGARAALAYKLLPNEEDASFVDKQKAVHKRSAERLLEVARAQGGMYVKIGQYLSTLTHILPKEWTETLTALQDRAPSVSWNEIRRVFEDDFGKIPEDVFSEIEEEPIAAASLAQVHRAKLKSTGEEVAIKIQYPNLKYIASSDMASLYFFFFVLEKLFPDYGYLWLFPEFRESVDNELNFLQESQNGQRVAAMFSNEPRVHIPRVYSKWTSSRVLCMEFVRGVKPSNAVALKEMGVDTLELASSISRFFGEQVHVHGFVHCDPHPGNLLVRLSPIDNKTQLVVLDHGMYRRLTPKFRVAYCKLWRALLTRNDILGLKACKDLGVSEKAYDVLSLMLVQRSAKSESGLGAKMTKEEVEALKSKYKDTQAADINRFMQKLPRDLLFVSRNTNMVRGLNLALGGTARGRFRITGQCAIKGLVLTDEIGEDSTSLLGTGLGTTLVSDATFDLKRGTRRGGGRDLGRGLNPLTESELQKQKGSLSLGRRLFQTGSLGYNIASLEYRLWLIDVVWPWLFGRAVDDHDAIEVAKG
jgi:aarF domain-containing kinase